MANLDGADEGAALARAHPTLEVGLHINLTRPAHLAARTLVRRDGSFRPLKQQIIALTLGMVDPDEVMAEGARNWRARGSSASMSPTSTVTSTFTCSALRATSRFCWPQPTVWPCVSHASSLSGISEEAWRTRQTRTALLLLEWRRVGRRAAHRAVRRTDRATSGPQRRLGL